MNHSEPYMDESLSLNWSTSCSSFDDSEWQKELKKHENFMPPELKIEFYDVMVLYSEKNKADAWKFCDHLTNIKLKDDKCVNAALYDEFLYSGGPKCSLLEKAMERSTYIFFFMTKEFCDDKWIELAKDECLMEAINNEKKQWCVIPVYTEDPAKSNLKIPVGVKSLKGINYYCNDHPFYEKGVRGLIENRLHQRLQKEKEQKGQQIIWLQNYKRQFSTEIKNIKSLENIEKMENKQEMEQKIKGKDVNEDLQDIGLLSLNPDVDGMHSKSDDQSQDTQMTPVNQSPSCWGTEVTVEEEKERSLETNAKDESMSVKTKEEEEYYSSLSEKEFAGEMKKNQDVHSWHKAKGSDKKQVATVTPRPKVCKDRDGEKTEARNLSRYVGMRPATPLLASACPIPLITLFAGKRTLVQSDPTSVQRTESDELD